jgi:VCBS repeat-containing protein
MSLPINDATLKNLILAAGAAKNYPLMYSTIAIAMKDGRIPGASSDQIYWFEQASKINGGDASSPASVFIRAATVAGLSSSGARTDSAHIQNISNDIGSKVYSDVRDAQAIPDFSQQLKDDISAAINTGGMTIGGWGGAFYYWKESYTLSNGVATTVGKAIVDNTTEYKKFTDGTAAAIAATVERFGGSVFSDPAFQAAMQKAAGNFLVNGNGMPSLYFVPTLMEIFVKAEATLFVRFGERVSNEIGTELRRFSGFSLLLSDATQSTDLATLAVDAFGDRVSGGGDEEAGDALTQKIGELLAGKDITGASIEKLANPENSSLAAAVVITLRSGETIAINSDDDVSYRLIQADDTGNVLWAVKNFDNSYQTVLKSVDGSTDTRSYSADDLLIGRTLTELGADGSQTTQTFDPSNRLTLTTKVQTFDDPEGQSTLSITTYPTGKTELLATDSTGQPSSLIITTPGSYNTETVQNYSYIDGKAVLNVSRAIETFYDENGTSRLETVTTYEGGIPTTVRSAYDTEGQLASSTPVDNPAATQLLGQRSVTTLNDIASLIGAIQGGRPLPILSSGLHLLNNTANPVGTAVEYPGLNLATGLVGGLASLYNLANALENGDTLSQVSATLNTLNYVNSTLPSMLGQASALSPALNTALNGSGGLVAGAAPGVLPVLGLIVSIKNEDPVGITIGLIGIANPALLTTPPAGWIVAGALILQALLQDPPPEAWGSAKIIFDENGQVRIDTVGESFGVDRVRAQMDTTLAVLNKMLASAQQRTPGAPLGIVPQRMPGITWREERQGDPGYALLDINPLTGEQRYPYLRFDDRGVPFSSNPAVWQPDPLDPGIRAGMTQQLIESALRRHAIAAQWEVDTARIQQDVGDPNAGLSEEERAAKSGLGASYDPVTGKPVGQFRPVTLDLDGNGAISTVAKDDASNTTAFDWDDSGFYKQVSWVQPNDGFLFLDRNLNGVVDSGKELLSNSWVSDNYKGVRSLDWVDANRDGHIDNIDPVFKELKVWQDLNRDGDNITNNADGSTSLDVGEVKTLSELGITELDYVNGRFTRGGNLFALKSDQLEADANGTRVNLVDNGIVVQDSNGTQQFIITKVTSLQGGADLVPGLYEDGDPNGAARTIPQEIAIPVSLLLANDSADPAVVSTLRLESVSAATHGTIRLGAQNGEQFVYFTPDANYNSTLGGDPSFNYVVRDTEGGQRTVTVKLPLAAVNDLAVVSVAPDAPRPVYGYPVVNYTYSERTGSGDDASYTTVNASFVGEPQYQPYVEHIPESPIYETRYVSNGDASYYESVLVGYTEAYDIAHLTPIAYDATNIGGFVVSDPDGPVGPSFFQIVGNPVYGTVTLDANTGQWSYVGRRPAIDEATGSQIGVNVDSNRYLGSEEKFTDVFTVRVYDAGGGVVDRNVEVTHYGPRPLPEVQGGGKKPIAIDLNGDGFSFTDVDDSNVFFDVNGDGWRRKVAWINPHDGLLAFDENDNGQIDSGLELSFARFKQGAQTDLQGLAAFDTNGDGRFTALDAKWAQFGVWQDANSNGVSDAGEFKSLGDMGVAEVGLTSDGHFQVINGQTVHGVGTVTKTDGSALRMADVTLKYTNETQMVNADGSTGTALLPTTQRGQIFTGTTDRDLVLGTQGSDRYALGGGDDGVVDDGGDDIVDAGAGNDLINTGIGNDVVLAGAGDDMVFAGEGNDVVFGDDATGNGDDLVMLQGGNDVAFGGGGNDFISGGDGNDAISGNEGDDQLFGEGGWDAVFGGDGSDELWGLDGNDLLDAGGGNDLLAGGAGDDVMQGGAGDDRYEVDSAADVVDETIDGGINGTSGSGDAGGVDTVRASISYTLGALIENLTLTGTVGLTGTANAVGNVLVGNEAGNTLHGLGGNDTLDGGVGADTLVGGTGDDTYVIDNVGDTVTEQFGEGTDTVRSRISYGLNSNVENLTLVGVNAIDGTGNELANALTGNAGANTLDGGAGSDLLKGGGGNDSYRFGLGYGVDTVIDAQGQNTLVFGSGIEAIDLRFSLNGTNLLIDVTTNGIATGDRVILQDWYLPVGERVGAERVSAVRFASGMTVQLDETALNHAPTVVADAAAMNEDSLRVGGNVLANDSDPDESNVLSVVGAGSYVGQYGTLVLAADGSYDYALRSGDADVQALQNGQSVSDTFAFAVTDNARFETATLPSSLAITVNGVNDAPVLARAIQAQTATEIVAFSLVLSADTFTDADAGDVLTLSATLADGSVLPTWLSFDADSRTFSGEPAYEDITAFFGEQPAALALRVTAVDTQGASATSLFSLTVNQSPELTVVGTDGADNLRGASRNDQLFGDGGNDVLRGMRGDDMLDGGAGADQLTGGLGNDSYVIDNAGDLVAEFFNQGYDQVSSSINYVLPQHVERLNLTGLALQGIGNDLDNALFGNHEANVLDGASGADQMSGAQGDDRYVIDSALDTVIEQDGQGNDTVYASVNYATAAQVENLVLTGSAITAGGNELSNVVVGNAGNNTLSGGTGNDLLAGWLGNDSLDGGAGNDSYLYNQGEGRDSIVDASGVDAVRFGAGITLDSLAAREYSVNGQRRMFVSVLNSNGEEQADQGIDFALSSTGVSPIEPFVLVNGQIFTLDQLKPALVTTNGGNNNDILVGSRADDTMDGSNGNDKLFGRTGNDSLYGGNGNDALFGEGGHDKLYGGNDGDLLAAGAGDDALTGDNGADVIVAGSGNDLISTGNDNDFVDAGAGNDSIDTGNGNDFIAGGKGNDTITAGLGEDLLAFNRGDGQDTVITQEGQQDTLSLGGGIRYDDLKLKRSGRDLIVDVGQGDQITLKDWYSALPGHRKNVARLQVVTAGGDFNAASADRLLNQTVVNFDFQKLTTAFDRVRTGNPDLTEWAALSGLSAAYLQGSSTQAIGGDLAYRYATLNSNSNSTEGASYGDLDWKAVRSRVQKLNGSLQYLTAQVPGAINPWVALQAGTSLIVEQPTGASSPITPVAALTQDQLVIAALGAQAQITGQSQVSWR